MKPTPRFVRQVRRVRHFEARINVGGRKHCDCQVMDISRDGAKVFFGDPVAPVPDRFELAFAHADNNRICEVIWRRSKMLGVRFIF